MDQICIDTNNEGCNKKTEAIVENERNTEAGGC